MGKEFVNKTTIIFLSFVACFGMQAMAQRVVVNFVRPGTNEQINAYVADYADEEPSFPGGEEAMRRFINHERNYPKEALREGLQGRVLCSFIVDVDGSINDIKVQRSSNECFALEAIRIIEKMPKWNPGRVNGHRVPVYYMLPIPFRL